MIYNSLSNNYVKRKSKRYDSVNAWEMKIVDSVLGKKN